MRAKRTKAAQSATTATRACLVAVGGAKGGVGKSMFATNLAVQLWRMGHRTTVVDLDLGGANQHLYLGYRALLASTMNDFVRGRVRSLAEVTVETRYGPKLIGGNSSELGSANLSHGRKLKMLRAIRDLDADYVVLDLGGDTSNNIVDCFNLADFGIVVTTRESAAYVGAYQFIKVALYRKLQRAFGTESRFAAERDPALDAILKEATSPEGANGRSVLDLVADVRTRAPGSVALLERILDDFRPMLVTNRIPAGVDVAPLVRSLQDVMSRWISKDVRHLGTVSAQREIEASAIELVPVLAKHPRGAMAQEMARIAERLIAQVRPTGLATFEEEVDDADVIEEIALSEPALAATDTELERPREESPQHAPTQGASPTPAPTPVRRPTAPRAPLDLSSPPRPSRSQEGLGVAAARAGTMSSLPVAPSLPSTPVAASTIAPHEPADAPALPQSPMAQTAMAASAANDSLVEVPPVDALQWPARAEELAWPEPRRAVETPNPG